MSVIQNNGFPGGFAGANVPEVEVAQGYPRASQGAGSYDAIRPIFSSTSQSGAPTAYAGYGGYNDGGGLFGFANIMNGFLNGLQDLLANLGRQFGLGGGFSQTSNAGGQQYFQKATAGSTVDPHESFDATGGDGNNVNGKWDSMASHSNLLSSDSFNGGYQVSTVATQPNANAVTMNDSATIGSGNGADAVTMHKDGSYAVSADGQNVALRTGQSVQLGHGESVTLNADKSLTETDSNGSGGTISTTLRANGQGGVDVSNTASHVDLGGYLVNRSDANPVEGGSSAFSPIDPYAYSQRSAPTAQPGWSWQQNLDNTYNVYNAGAEPEMA